MFKTRLRIMFGVTLLLVAGTVAIAWRTDAAVAAVPVGAVFVVLGVVSLGAAAASLRLRDPGFGQLDAAEVQAAVRREETGVADDARLGEDAEPRLTFFEGVRQTVLAPDELLIEFAVPATGPRSGGAYLRHTPRRELDIAVVGVASQVSLVDGVCRKARIALAAVAPVPVRATAAEQALEGQPLTPQAIARAADLAVDAARPISDQRGSAEFRRHLVRVLTRRTLTLALERATA